MGFLKRNSGGNIEQARKTSDIDGLMAIVEEGPLARSAAATRTIMELGDPGGIRQLQDRFVGQLRHGQDTAQLEAVGLLQGRPYRGILYAISTEKRYGLEGDVEQFASTFTLQDWSDALIDVVNDLDRSPFVRWAAALGLARFGERMPELASSIAELGEALLDYIVSESPVRGYHAKKEVFDDSIRALGWFHGVAAAGEALIGATQGRRFAVWNQDEPSAVVFEALVDLGGDDAYEALRYWSGRSDTAKNALMALESKRV